MAQQGSRDADEWLAREQNKRCEPDPGRSQGSTAATTGLANDHSANSLPRSSRGCWRSRDERQVEPASTGVAEAVRSTGDLPALPPRLPA
jgi:hypothetical protein